eukprot:CAMPEP_0168192584 /NCGR_PEP_ID=MMETSP0139_2-20121125/18127_1 /TAXON_ID=44445 /ORGANISM="Pseudo-nitzschia australis, Strain 10249 10 AB" /LENGTH=164 /DNA_ID=CAMNT_0008115835 /DNA_START=97 /DNA_END=588 /DNA_ORIENTATION=-
MYVELAPSIAKVAVETKSTIRKYNRNLDEWVQNFCTKHLELGTKLELYATRNTPEHIEIIIEDKLGAIEESLRDHMQFGVENTDKKTNDTNTLLNQRFDALSSQMSVILSNQRNTPQTLAMTPPQTLALTSPTASRCSHDTSTLTDTVSVATPLPEKIQKKAAR